MNVALNPFQICLGPRFHSSWLALTVSKQKFAEPMPGPQLILFRRLAGADQIAQGFVRCVRNPDRGQISRSMTARKFLCVPPVRLHPVSGLHGNQGRRHDLAFHAQRGQLPIQNVSSRTGLVASPKAPGRPEFPDQLPHRFKPVRDGSQRTHLTARLGNSHSNRLGMDIQSNKA
jgi:hypothetical protein